MDEPMSRHEAQHRSTRHRRRPTVLARHGRSDDGDAFIADPGSGPALAPDDFAEALAEGFLVAVTAGDEVAGAGRYAEDEFQAVFGSIITLAAEAELAAVADGSPAIQVDGAAERREPD
jgi:hypothetical protein